MTRRLGVVLLGMVVFSGRNPVAAQRNTLAPADTMVDVGGYRLHFRTIRGTGPTIVLESGGGLDASQWDAVAPDLAQATGSAVVAYDRAGFGESDLPKTRYDIRTEVAALWKALDGFHLADSVILVGHSYGGFLITLSAHEHPKQVRGLVFVDPNVASFVDAMGGPEAIRKSAVARGQVDTMPPERQTKGQRANTWALGEFPATIAVLRSTKIPKGIPVRVISAGKEWWPTAKENREFRRAHEQLAGSVRDGRHLIAEHSAHMVTVEQPNIVEGTVVDLIRQLRTPAP